MATWESVVWTVNGTAIEATDRDGATTLIASLYDERDGVDDWRSNAALMAAAPSLYRALLAIVEIGEPFVTRPEQKALAKAALKRARGITDVPATE